MAGTTGYSYETVIFFTLCHVRLCNSSVSRQEFWRALLCPPPGDLPNPGTEARSPALQVDSLPPEPPGKPYSYALELNWTPILQGFPESSVKNLPADGGHMSTRG